MGLEAGAYNRTTLPKIGFIIRARAPSTKSKQSQVNLGANAKGVSGRDAGVMVLFMQMMPDLTVASTS